MNLKKIILMIGFSFLGVGCSSINMSDNKLSLEHWKTFNTASPIKLDNIDQAHAMVVFFRDKNELSGPAANIFIDGEYLTSLQPGGYKTIALCANPTRMTSAYTQSNLNYLNVRQQDNIYSLRGGEINYFRLGKDEKGLINLFPVSEAEAKKILLTAQEQVNTLSRVETKRTCQKVLEKDIKPIILKKYTLRANTLFKYGQSDENNILLEGRKDIVSIAAEIKNELNQISHIAIIGYADPVGSEVFNQQLSQRRAATVRNLLVAEGIEKQKILIEGRGKQDLVVSGCEKRFQKNKLARDKCNMANRRVEIITYGVKAE